MNPVLDTLFLPLQRGDVAPTERAVFFNAQYHVVLEDFRNENLFLQQHFRPYADDLQRRGFNAVPELKDIKVPLAFVLLPKNAAEARYFVAAALNGLEEGGMIVLAAANDAGGSRLKKMLQQFGLKDIYGLSKNHARAAWTVKGNINQEFLQTSFTAGRSQPVLNGKFQSLPGLFAWNKIDQGSKILMEHLPEDLKGRGADFGCGYGALAFHVLEHCKSIEHLCCIDADARAIEACKTNLKTFKNIDFSWADLTSPLGAPGGLDWIVMNPPFHEGKGAESGIGRGFITTAANSLKPGGTLWMVANAGLPYEQALEKSFASFRKLYEGSGFKIYCAVK